MKIWCPKCQWKPSASSLWQCECGCLWNTFQTRAVCPDCGQKYSWTQCLACHVRSPHEDWYHDDGLKDENLAVFRDYMEELERARPRELPTPAEGES